MEAQPAPKPLHDMTLPELIAESLRLQALEKAANEIAAARKSEKSTVDSMIRDIMRESEQTSTTTTTGSALLTAKTVQNVTDWDALYGYILENKALYLLQRRVSSTALAEALALGEVPGVENVNLTLVTVKPLKVKP